VPLEYSKPWRRSIPTGQLLIGGRWRDAADGAVMTTLEAPITAVAKAIRPARSRCAGGAIAAGRTLGTGVQLRFWRTLEIEARRDGDRLGIPLASYDPHAMDTAAALVRDAGFAPVVVGPLVEAQRFDPGAPIHNSGMSGTELERALGLRGAG